MSEVSLNSNITQNCKMNVDGNRGKTIRIKKTKKKVSDIEDNIQTIDEPTKVMSDIEDNIQTIDEPTKVMSDIEENILSHLGNYTEEPFTIIESYFRGQHLERLVRHQIESYNHFINYQIQRTIQMFNSVTIHSENDYVQEKDQYLLEIDISFGNFKLYPPQIHENNGATKIMLPDEAKIRNFTYASTMAVDLNIKYTIRNSETMDNPRVIYKTLPKINIGKMPIMIKSSICIFT